MLRFSDVDLQGKRVLIREDLNVPLNDRGEITDDTRLRSALPTIQQALAQGSQVMVMSHLGRPKAGSFDQTYSLKPVADYLQQALARPVRLVRDWVDGIEQQDDALVLCENVRFNDGEKSNDDELAKKMAALCDVFVMDAFATAHRAQASTEGVVRFAPIACAGPLLQRELDALHHALQSPAKPVVAIVGGSKVSSKIDVLTSLLDKVDTLIVGGGIANTLLAAKGYDIHASLYEPEWCEKAQAFFDAADKKGVAVPLPVDVVVTKQFSADAESRVCAIDQVQPGEMILDIGPETASRYAECLATAKTIIWNGPVGVFEMKPFSHGTERLAQAIADSEAYSIAGGGDTVAAINQFGIEKQVSYISTGGGAFLSLLQDETLPAVAALQARSAKVC